MNQLICGIKGFIVDEDGVTMIEYGLLAALIAIVSILAITTLGQNLHSVFTKVCSALNTALGTGGTACS